jgi:hypothetical protein
MGVGLRRFRRKVMRALNVRFYEGVCQAPLNPGMFNGVVGCLLWAVVVTALALIRWLPQVFRFKVGVCRASEPVLGLTSIRAGTRPVTTYRIRAKRWVQTPVTTAPHLCERSPVGNPRTFRAR